MTAAPVVPGALVEVPAGVVVRGELVSVMTGALIASISVDTELVTASPTGSHTLINILTLSTVRVNTLETSRAPTITIIRIMIMTMKTKEFDKCYQRLLLEQLLVLWPTPNTCLNILIS